MSRNIAFLTYLSRSGSTYLASKLNNCADICIGIEADFIDGWITPGFQIASQEQMEAYFDKLYENYKFCQWKIDRIQLTNQVIQHGFPICFSRLLAEALSLYFNDSVCKIIIHKCGHYYRAVESIRQEMPEAKFIFIDRDPRAIFSSMKKSLDSRTSKPMLEDVLHFTFGYIDTQKRIKQHMNDPFFHVVRYEHLLRNEDEEIDDICDFLGVQREKKKSRESYFDSIPTSQKHLHKNISIGNPDINRMDGWKTELDAADITVLETALKGNIIENGYKLSGIVPDTRHGEMKAAMNMARFWYELHKRRILSLPHKY